MARDQRLTSEQSQLITGARTLGLARAIPISLDDNELSRILAVILLDTSSPHPASLSVYLPAGTRSYYDLPLEWFQSGGETGDLVASFLSCADKVPDFETYFKCLCDIHKRRRKYERILSAQPMPTMDQVAPRALLEFGIIATPGLASWITWRKWFYDIDNRAAQETGYLFEPILAASLGGVCYSASKSPVRRRSDANKGRQVDCIVDKTAYEFKLRVTIAASGQGRFGEELDFAEDCKSAGFAPVLLVLDPTPSSRLTELVDEFSRVGGSAFIGDDAWAHLEVNAGPTMATFVEKYVRQPIAAVDSVVGDLLGLTIEQVPDESRIAVQLSDAKHAYSWQIERSEDSSLTTDGNED